jgi:low affinity Fe/Cu permease
MTKKKKLFEHFSNWATTATGSSAAFIIAILAIVICLLQGL